MDDRIFDMLTELIGSVNELKKEVQEIKHNNLRFENEVSTKLSTLFDGYKLNYEVASLTREDVKNLAKKVENHEVKLKVVP